MSKKDKHIKDKHIEEKNADITEENIKDQCKCEDNCNCEAENSKKCCCNNESNEKIAFLSNHIKELEDAVLRSQAELLNYRKRKDEETARILKYAEEDVLKGFLPILDNFERAITMDDNNFGDETSKFLEGFRMVYSQTKTLLEKFEVKEVDCLGKEFDPAIEQAISTEKDESKPSGIVLKVYQKGYMYKDKVLRLAMVIVNE
jgi:molecular chaperone GrpE